MNLDLLTCDCEGLKQTDNGLTKEIATFEHVEMPKEKTDQMTYHHYCKEFLHKIQRCLILLETDSGLKYKVALKVEDGDLFGDVPLENKKVYVLVNFNENIKLTKEDTKRIKEAIADLQSLSKDFIVELSNQLEKVLKIDSKISYLN